MALIVEAAELVEHFQWLTEGQSKDLSEEKLAAVAMEIADNQIYLLRLMDVIGVDIESSVVEKIQLNRKRYSVERSRGISGRR